MASTRWLASLSDGSTVIEQWIAGEKSPWVSLLEKLNSSPDLHITQLRLQINGITLTSASNAEGYYQACRVSSTCGGPSSASRGIGYVKGDVLHMIWVSEETGDIWQEERPCCANGVWRRR